MKKKLILAVLCMLCISHTVMAGSIKIIDETWDENIWNTIGNGVIETNGGLLKINTNQATGNVGVYTNALPNAAAFPRMPISEHYELETSIKIDDAFEGNINNGWTLWICNVSNEYDMSIYLASDGIYAYTDNDMQKIVNEIPDFEEHIYKIAANNGYAELYIDGEWKAGFNMPADSSGVNTGIISKGSRTDSVAVTVDYIKVTSITENEVIVDYAEDESVYDSVVNVELAEYASPFYQSRKQFDLIDPSADGYITYKVPDGTEITDFIISTRHNAQNQGSLTFQLSSDGINWSNHYIGTQTWEFANGGHRKITIPNEEVNISGCTYLRVRLVAGDSGGGGATESSPSLLGVTVMYTLPKYIGTIVNGNGLSDNTVIPVKNDGITVNLSSEADSDSVLNNIILLKDDNNIAIKVNIDAGQINIVPEEGFEYGQKYTLRFNENLINVNGVQFEDLPESIQFKTAESDYEMKNIKFEGEDECIVSADISNYDGEDAQVTLMVLGYKDGILSDYNYNTVTVKDGETLTDVHTPAINAAECDKITVMLWNDLIQMTALAKPITK